MKLKILIVALIVNVGLFAQKSKIEILDKKGKLIYSSKEGDYRLKGGFKFGIAPITEGNNLGFINTKGEVVIPIQYLADAKLGYEFVADGILQITDKNNKTALVDSTGKFITTFKDYYVWPFRSGDYSTFKSEINGIKQFGFINKKGKEFLVSSGTTYAEPFFNMLIVKDNDNKFLPSNGYFGEWCLLDTLGNNILNNKLRNITPVSPQLICISQDIMKGTTKTGDYTFYNMATKKYLIDHGAEESFTSLRSIDLGNGYEIIYGNSQSGYGSGKNNYYNEGNLKFMGILYNKEKFIAKFNEASFNNNRSFSFKIEVGEPIMGIQKEKSYQLYNLYGKKISELEFSYYKYLKDINLCFVDKFNEKVSLLIDTAGNTVSTFNYPVCTYVNNGYFGVRNSTYGKMALIDSKGKQVLDSIYNNFKVYGDVVVASKNYQFGLVSLSGKVILDFDYSEITPISTKGNMLFSVVKNQKRGIVDKNNKIIVPCIYDKIEWSNTNTYVEKFQQSPSVFSVSLNGKIGLIDTSAKMIQPLIYDELYFDKNATIIAQKGKSNVLNYEDEKKYVDNLLNNHADIIIATGKLNESSSEYENIIDKRYNNFIATKSYFENSTFLKNEGKAVKIKEFLTDEDSRIQVCYNKIKQAKQAEISLKNKSYSEDNNSNTKTGGDDLMSKTLNYYLFRFENLKKYVSKITNCAPSEKQGLKNDILNELTILDQTNDEIIKMTEYPSNNKMTDSEASGIQAKAKNKRQEIRDFRSQFVDNVNSKNLEAILNAIFGGRQ